MYPWIIILFVMAGIMFGLDYLIRRKRWKDNSRGEKISLIINMFSVARIFSCPYSVCCGELYRTVPKLLLERQCMTQRLCWAEFTLL